jgi:hypothetical protein
LAHSNMGTKFQVLSFEFEVSSSCYKTVFRSGGRKLILVQFGYELGLNTPRATHKYGTGSGSDPAILEQM